MKIYSKAQLSITPEIIKKEYASYLHKNPPKEEWVYQVISTRGKDNAICKSVIEHVAQDLRLNSTRLTSIYEELKDLPEIKNQSVALNISNDFIVDNKNLSAEHRAILTRLNANEFSPPIAQLSRADNSTVYRIFHLKSHTIKQPPTFNEMSDELENNLLNEAAQKEREVYKEKLYKKFGIDQDFLKQILPDDYQPFILK